MLDFRPQKWRRSSAGRPLAAAPVILLGLAFGIWYMIWATVRAKRSGPVCEQCGRRYNPRGQPANSTLCAQCRYRSLPRAKARRQQVVRWLIIITGLTFLMALIGLPLWNPLVARVGLLSWIFYPLLAFGATLSWLLAVFATIAIFIVIRNWRLRFDRPVFARARKSARDEGTIARIGPLTIWWCGPTDPVPLVAAQMEAMRRSFVLLVDQPVDAPALRVLVFHERRAFSRFHGNAVADHSAIECLYSGRPARLLTLATEVPRFRAIDDSRCLRSGFVLYLLEALWGSLSSHWLQFGLSGALSSDSNCDAREQLLRRMKVAKHNGTTLKAPTFFSKLNAFQTRELLGPLHDRFTMFAQFRAQSCSLVEYLAGSAAPADRLGRFRSFLCDLKAGRTEEVVFKRHFGYGFRESCSITGKPGLKSRAWASTRTPPAGGPRGDHRQKTGSHDR